MIKNYYKMATIMAAMFWGSGAWAQTAATGPNKVYIEQVGNSNTVTIEQVGGTNNVGGTNTTSTIVSTVAPIGITTLVPEAPSSNNYATITGSSNNLTITQTGSNNSAQYNIKGNNNNYTSTVTGNSNQTKLTVGDATTNGLRNIITETITGDSNLIIQNVVGTDNSTITSVTGNSNQITSDQTTNYGSITNTISGNSNIFNIQQIDAGPHILVANTLGDFNSVTTQQQGTNATTVNIQTTGSHNTITVRTSSSAIIGPQTAVAR